jgi:hypothetical protein
MVRTKKMNEWNVLYAAISTFKLVGGKKEDKKAREDGMRCLRDGCVGEAKGGSELAMRELKRAGCCPRSLSVGM